MTSLKLKGHDSLFNSDPNSGLGRLPSPVRRSKCIKVDWYSMFEMIKSFPGRLPERQREGKG